MEYETMDKIISVIIPSYNVGQYLGECVYSLTQSKYVDDIEIVIVNDGSKDNTLKLSESLRGQFPNTINIIDKENGGHGSTINRGVRECSGKYFKIIDADDWVDTGEFDKLIEKLYEVDVDCVICNYTSVYEVDDKSVLSDSTADLIQGKTYSYVDYIKKHRLAMHSLTYKTKKYLNADIVLDEKCFYVDTEFIYYPLKTFESVICFPYNVYQYRLQRKGQSVSFDGFIKHIEDHRKVLSSLVDFYNSFPKEKSELKNFIQIEIARHIMYQQSFLINEKTTKQQWLAFKKFIKSIRYANRDIYKKISLKYRFVLSLGIKTVHSIAKFN